MASQDSLSLEYTKIVSRQPISMRPFDLIEIHPGLWPDSIYTTTDRIREGAPIVPFCNQPALGDWDKRVAMELVVMTRTQ